MLSQHKGWFSRAALIVVIRPHAFFSVLCNVAPSLIPLLQSPAPFICSSCPQSTWVKESVHHNDRESRETLIYTAWSMEARRGNPGATSDYLGFMKAGRKSDLHSSLPNTWCIHSFSFTWIILLHALLYSLLFFLQFLFHTFLVKWGIDFLQGDSI